MSADQVGSDTGPAPALTCMQVRRPLQHPLLPHTLHQNPASRPGHDDARPEARRRTAAGEWRLTNRKRMHCRRAPRAGQRARRAWTRRIAVVAGFMLVPGLLTPSLWQRAADAAGQPEPPADQADKVSPLTAGEQEDRGRDEEGGGRRPAQPSRAPRPTRRRSRHLAHGRQGHRDAARLRHGQGHARDPPRHPRAPGQPREEQEGRSGAGSVTVEVLDQCQTKKLGVKGVVLTVPAPPTAGRPTRHRLRPLRLRLRR